MPGVEATVLVEVCSAYPSGAMLSTTVVALVVVVVDVDVVTAVADGCVLVADGSGEPRRAAVMFVTCVKGCCHTTTRTQDFLGNLLVAGDSPAAFRKLFLSRLRLPFRLPLLSLHLSFVHSADHGDVDNRARHYNESAIIDGEKEMCERILRAGGYPRSSRRITTMTTTMTATAVKVTTTTTRMTSTRMMTTTTK